MTDYRMNIAQVGVEWNGSATFNVYYCGENVDCFTHYGATPDNWQALAQEWVNDWWGVTAS